MFWTIVGIIGSVFFLICCFVLYVIGEGIKDMEEDYRNGYKNPFE